MAQSQQQNHENLRAKQNHRAVRTIEGFHVTSLQQNLPSHAARSGHVGSHKIWPNSLLLKLHKA